MSDRTLTALRDANPSPLRPIDDRPTTSEMLLIAQSATQTTAPSETRRPIVVMSMAFAVVLILVGILAVVGFAAGGGQEPSSPPVSPIDSTVTSTTVAEPPPDNARTSTLLDDAQIVLDEFARHYTEGDVDGLLSLLIPGTVKTTVRDAELEYPWEIELLRYQLAVDAALNTSLVFDSCQPLQSGSVSCLSYRENDLTLIAGIEPQAERVTLRVEDGFISMWQDRQGFDATPYQQEAVAPFTAWLAEVHPEILDPHPLDGGVSYWRPDRDILERLGLLVSEYAGDRGIPLDT